MTKFIEVNGFRISIHTVFPEYLDGFLRDFSAYESGLSSSRWRVVCSAVNSGAYSDRLDELVFDAQAQYRSVVGISNPEYLARISYGGKDVTATLPYREKERVARRIMPWFPTEGISIVDAIDGSIDRRNDVAELLHPLGAGVAYEYFCRWRELGRGHPLRLDLSFEAKEELLARDLIRLCDESHAMKFIEWLGFQKLKSIFASAGLPPPRGYSAATETISSVGGDLAQMILDQITAIVDPQEYFIVPVPQLLTRDNILDVRTRAQLLVNAIDLVHWHKFSPQLLAS